MLDTLISSEHELIEFLSVGYWTNELRMMYYHYSAGVDKEMRSSFPLTFYRTSVNYL